MKDWLTNHVLAGIAVLKGWKIGDDGK